MKAFSKFVGVLAAGVALSMAVGLMLPSESTYAKEDTKAKETAQVTYSYKANAGDTYTQMVRKAVQTYGIKHDVDLGVGRIIAIETRVSSEANWPLLNQGQAVSFSEGLIKTWIDESLKMSDADVAAWATYAPYVNFDTRGVGEGR